MDVEDSVVMVLPKTLESDDDDTIAVSVELDVSKEDGRISEEFSDVDLSAVEVSNEEVDGVV
ncbi:uncharacterized protein ColSpa_02742 [Colletotrichum spaethianum]|uniref:Uncharacterized protein n=1 Tax=Colletotrichum spaethianum TaxID=700344 RepID=A0AA37P506_9PEZI|nr:uncharacterized protein ColSpa_02742 [Colletotrichum spaethianum]GKT42561.1 hypothetical protein ColSpa_02742 [Colletotrichum spaethianum]